MRLNHFFFVLFAFSLSLFLFLKPQSYVKASGEEVAQLEIEDFTVYELSKEGVDSVVSGTIGRQYIKYYEVENAHYIENKNRLGEHLYADRGKFEDDMAYMDENVRYFREDGISFESDHAIYNTKKEHLYVPKNFVLTQNENIVYGKELHYSAKTGDVSAQKVDANYYIEDRK